MEIECRELAYGDCFVRFHEARTLVLKNKSPVLTGLFRVVPQEPATYAVARVSPEPEEGQVRNSHAVEIPRLIAGPTYNLFVSCVAVVRVFGLSCAVVGVALLFGFVMFGASAAASLPRCTSTDRSSCKRRSDRV